MSVAREIVEIAFCVCPDQVTFVPEKRKELTTEGGLDVAANIKKIQWAINNLRKRNVEISLFIDPIKSQIDASCKLGVDIIELHTGRYANARTPQAMKRYLEELRQMARYAKAKGLIVNAGHGLDYNNVAAVAGILELEELNIGYSIVCRAALVGLGRAVREMKALIK